MFRLDMRYEQVPGTAAWEGIFEKSFCLIVLSFARLNLQFWKSTLADAAVGVSSTSKSLAIAQVSKFFGFLAGTGQQ